jgi:hypothetical protein
VDLNCFHYDQVSVFLRRGRIGQEISISALMSLISRCSNCSEAIPVDLPEKVSNLILTDQMSALKPAVLNAGLAFLHKNGFRVCVSSDLLVNLIKSDFAPHVLGSLIHFLQFNNPSEAQIAELLPFFENWAFGLGEDMTPVHIALAEILGLYLESSIGLIIALKLLVDDVPLVRTLAVKAVCAAFSDEFVSELLCFRCVVKRLGIRSKTDLVAVGVKWLNIIQKKLEIDVRGEVLTVLVDELFIVREVLKEIGFRESFEFSVGGLLKVRSEFVNWALTALGNIFVGDN